MDWQMIGAVGELLGAGAVVGTLFYLGRPGMQRYWRDRSHWFSSGFHARVNRLIEDAQPTMTEAYRISD